jgi:tRNA threonylcarbamoyladenosine biosynthesis protein TsaE
MLTIDVPDERGTARLGRRIGRHLRPGDVVGLIGDLGAGKTALTRSIARGLGVPASVRVCSPTFTILNMYDGGRNPLYHLDLYRVSVAEELVGIGLDDLLSGDGIMVVEWLDRFPEPFGPDYLAVTIEATGDTSRRFTFTPHGPRAAQLLAVLRP